MIIPVLDDTPALVRLLRQLAQQRPEPQEIIVVDGGATANKEVSPVASVCAANGARYFAAPPGRGCQLRAGAACARGKVLWFLHADAGLSPGATAAIGAAIDGGAVGGYFRFQFAGPHNLTKQILEYFVSLRCRWGGVYGDQGIFVRRPFYDQAGGFEDTALFEEVRLVRGLRSLGEFLPLSEPIAIDTRRWDSRGYWRQTLINRLLALGYALGLPPERLANWYRGRS